MEKSTCSFAGCENPSRSKNLCVGHYAQQWRGESLRPLSGRALTEDQRFWTHVRKGESCWDWTGAIAGNGADYGRFVSNGRTVQAHRWIYERTFEPIPPRHVVDHICHNTLCVNPDHLRAVTVKQNAEHRIAADRDSKSGVRGVHWNRRANKWRVQIRHNRKLIHVGLFSDLDDANSAAIAKRNELFTHNDPDRATA